MAAFCVSGVFSGAAVVSGAGSSVDSGVVSGSAVVSGASGAIGAVASTLASSFSSGSSAVTSGRAGSVWEHPSVLTVTSTGELFQLMHFCAWFRFSSLMPSGTRTVSLGATFIISPMGDVVRSQPSKQISARFGQLMMQFSPKLFILLVKCRLVRFWHSVNAPYSTLSASATNEVSPAKLNACWPIFTRCSPKYRLPSGPALSKA